MHRADDHVLAPSTTLSWIPWFVAARAADHKHVECMRATRGKRTARPGSPKHRAPALSGDFGLYS